MIKTITGYELRHWVKQYPIYFYTGFLMLLGASSMLIGGDILGEKNVDPDGNFWANSPLAIYGNVINQLNILIFFMIPAIYGAAVNRDYRSKMHMILYSYPIKTRDYFVSKYISASIITVLIVCGLGFGIAIGENFPGLNSNFIGPFRPFTYFVIYGVFIIPNVLMFGAIVFTIVGVSRNIYAGYVVILVLILFRTIVGGVLSSPDYIWLAASLDPYAGLAGMFYSGEWTMMEKNTLMIPIKGVVLYNRLFWLMISFLIVWWGRRRLSLTHNKFAKATPHATLQRSSVSQIGKVSSFDLQSVVVDNSNWQQLKSTFSLAFLQFKTIAKSRSFIAIALGTYVLMFILLGQVNAELTTGQRPFTQVILQIPTLFYTFLVSILTYIYSGYLVHRLKSAQMNQIVDCTPTSNSSMIGAHLLTMTLIQTVLVSSILIVGVLIQVYFGETPVDLGQYCLQLYGITLITLVIWTTLSLFVHALIPNIYLGIFLLIIGSIGIGGLGDLGVDLDVFKFNSAPHPEYSDMTGFKGLFSYFVHKGFWLLFGLLLLYPTYLLWCRGSDQSIKNRIMLIRKRATNSFLFLSGLLTICVVLFGGWIYSETKTIPPLLKSDQLKSYKKDVELSLKDYIDIDQPSQVSLKIELDLYPSNHSYDVSAQAGYVNKGDQPIDNIWMDNNGHKSSSFKLNKEYTVIQQDSILNFQLVKLQSPLAVGDSVMLSYEYEVTPRSVLSNTLPIEHGGTYLMPDFPNIGVPDIRLKDSSDRESYQLAPFPQEDLLPQDSLSNVLSYVGKDFLNYEAVISTIGGQIAITSGDLIDQWTENERSFFHYRSSGKIRNGFVVMAGQYAVMQEEYKGKLFSIYHHPDHIHNIGRMMNSMKATLDYCEENFGAYQFDDMKIVEFPKVFGNFAQSFAGLIAYSEKAGFLINVDTSSKKRWDSPFRLTSHEMSHQWWGHQVVPSLALGSKFVTEGLAEYTAAKLLEENFGIEKLKRLITVSRERYFRSRNGLKNESPLVTVPPEQTVVAYHKGCLALLTLDYFLGDNNLNGALKAFVKENRFSDTPYPTSINLIESIESVTPDSLIYLLNDLTRRVILYDNQVLNAKVSSTETGQFKVVAELIISKYHGDQQGISRFLDDNGETLVHVGPSEEETKSLALKDYIPISIFGKSAEGGEKVIFRTRVLVTEISNEISFLLDEEPTSIVIDPLSLLMDRVTDDNVIEFE